MKENKEDFLDYDELNINGDDYYIDLKIFDVPSEQVVHKIKKPARQALKEAINFIKDK